MAQSDPTFRSHLVAELPRLRALARQLAAGADADDLAQDTMVRALCQESQPSKLRAWLGQVLRNSQRATARSHARRKAREVRIAGDTTAAELPVDLEHAQMLGAVQQAVGELEEPYRSALKDRFLHDRSAADLARAEGCPAATVRWRVQEGLRRTRRKLDERFDGRSQWLGGMLVAAGPSLPPTNPITPTQATQPMTKLALLKVLTAVAVVAATTSVVVASSPDVTAASEAHKPASTPSVAVARAATATPPSPPREAQWTVPPVSDPKARSLRDEPATVQQPQEPAPEVADPARQIHQLEREIIACTGVDELPDGASILLDMGFVETPRGAVFDRGDIVELEGLTHVDEAKLQACIDQVLAELQVVFSSAAPPVSDEPSTLQMRVTGPDDSSPEPTRSENEHTLAPHDAIAALSLPTRGGATAKVSVVMCGDFDCPFCDRVRPTIDRIIEDYGDDVAVAWMHHPLAFHKGAEPAARAAAAAGAQGKFWQMYEALFNNPQARDRASVVALASELGMDADAFASAFDDPATAEAVVVQATTCTANGGRATPSFFVNGSLLTGAQSFEKFAELIESELAG